MRGERRFAWSASVGRSEGKRKLGRPRRGWEGNIKIDLKQIELEEDVEQIIWFRIGARGGLL